MTIETNGRNECFKYASTFLKRSFRGDQGG
jgi:hypothetical protein